MSISPGRDAARVLIAAAAVLVLAVTAFHDLRLDDAYITFRYGQNLARGLGMVFNRGQRIMGSTSPGGALLSAMVYRVCGHAATPDVMSALGCAGWEAQAVSVFFILRDRLGSLRAQIVAAGIAVGVAGSAQWVALETNLAAAGTLGAIALASQSRWTPAATLCAMAGLMRPDAYVVCLPLGWLAVRELGKHAWKPAAVFAALAAPWPLFATVYFGKPIPQSAITKYHGATPSAYALHELVAIPTQHLAAMPSVARVAFWLAAIAGAVLVVRADRRLGVLAAYAGHHAAAYVLLAPDPAFTWHLYPLTLVSFVFALVAASTLVERLHGAARAVAAVVVVGASSVGTIAFARSHASDAWFGGRDTAYRAISKYLVDHANPIDIVDAEEVGTLAYYTDLKMNDRGRLLTPYPGDVFWRLTHGRPTKLRWLVLNRAQIELGIEKPYYEGRPPVLFQEGGWGLLVVDIRAPRTDGGKSEWD